MTLTQVGIAWPDISKRVASFFFEMRKYYPTLKAGYGVEFNPAGTGAHALCYMHTATNENISSKVVAKAASRVGIGPVFDLQRPRPNSTQTFFQYQFKSLATAAGRAAYRVLNGPKGIFHTSKSGFYRDGIGGRPLTAKQAKSQEATYRACAPFSACFSHVR